MHIAFLGGFLPKEIENDIINKSKLSIQNAANAYQWAFIHGLESNFDNGLTLITAPFIGYYPTYYSSIILRTSTFLRKGKRCVSVGFINLPLIKNIHKYIGILKNLNEWSLTLKGEKVIIVYSMNLAYLKAAVQAKKNNPSIKICLIVTDLPEFPADSNILYKFYIDWIEKPMVYNLLECVDSFVLLTDKMAERLNVGDKLWTRVEGLFDIKSDVEQPTSVDDDIKIIFYSGTLNLRYGIDHLLKAFDLIPNENYELWVCGGGSGRNLVEEYMKKDQRITYFGLIPREEVLKLQKKASLLINPRGINGEYNEYSFPSKTMEYLASGTPTLIYRLNGIPTEYFEYCYSLEDTDVYCLVKKIVEILESDYDERKKIGDSARNFILERKNAKAQCAKVIDMLVS